MIHFDQFVHRPVGTALLALGVVLVGTVAFFNLPVAPLPQVDFPTITVAARLPGASAETMASAVATPLEREFSNIAGVSEMTSSSSLGLAQVTLQFDLAIDINAAAQDVQAAINAAGGALPKGLPSPPTYLKANPADAPILALALSSSTLPLIELGRYVEDFVLPQLAQIPGVGLIDFHGQQRPAIRLQLDPDKVATLGLTLEDVRAVVFRETVNAPKGALNGRQQTVVINASDQITTAEGYRQLIVAYRNGAPVRLGELGAVVEAAEDLLQAAWLQNRRAITIDVHKQPGFNVVSTVQLIRERLPALAAALPAAAQLTVVSDRTQTISAAVHDVEFTMLITVGLVVLVIFVFLRDPQATLVPALAIPISLIGTFAVMQALGYSLDNLSLMALTIAIGFVVDDAIVVVENVVRHLETGVPPVQAAIGGVREVSSTIVSMTLSLIAVFIPILLMGGIVGRLFREFAVTVSVAVLISGVVSLTVTPMVCAWVLQDKRSASHGRWFRWFEKLFDRMHRGYAQALDQVLAWPRLMLGVTAATALLAGWLYIDAPKGFFPLVDSGLIDGFVQTEADISYDEMARRMLQVGQVVSADEDVDNAYYWIGSNPTLSRGRMIVNLKAASARKASAAQVMARLKPQLARLIGVSVSLQMRQDLRVGGRISGAQYQYTLQDADVDELNAWAPRMLAALKAMPQLSDVNSDAQAAATSARLVIDRDTAGRLGVSAQAIDDVLYDAYGQRQVATMFTAVNQYKVIEEVQPDAQLGTEALRRLFVRSASSGQLVPLAMLGRISRETTPVTLNHQSLFPAVTLSFNLAPGVALGDAVQAIHQMESRIGKPLTLIANFAGTAKAFEASLRGQPYLILAALVVVYIVLGVLYESLVHPLTIISTLPSAGIGALVALRLAGHELSIMGLIGIFLLIGVVKKNAIMMIDFALEAERSQGLTPRDAIRQGALLRLRPILMTSCAALMGALPLALGSGVGAELRVPLGISIAGGLVFSQALTLFTTPVVYLWLARGSAWATRRRAQSSLASSSAASAADNGK